MSDLLNLSKIVPREASKSSWGDQELNLLLFRKVSIAFFCFLLWISKKGANKNKLQYRLLSQYVTQFISLKPGIDFCPFLSFTPNIGQRPAPFLWI
jgi:hypothetical protein